MFFFIHLLSGSSVNFVYTFQNNIAIKIILVIIKFVINITNFIGNDFKIGVKHGSTGAH